MKNGSSPAKSGLIYYLAKLAWDVTDTGETAMGGRVGKCRKGSKLHTLVSTVAVVLDTKHGDNSLSVGWMISNR